MYGGKQIYGYIQGASHSSALGEIHFQASLVARYVILFNQPWHDVFAKLTFSLHIFCQCVLGLLQKLINYNTTEFMRTPSS